MIARVRMLLPFRVYRQRALSLQSFELAYAGQKVTVWPLLQSQLGPVEADPLLGKPLHEILLKLDPPEQEQTIDIVEVNNVSGALVEVLQLDFRGSVFSRVKTDPESFEPTVEVVFDVANHVLSGIRSASRGFTVELLAPSTTNWRVDYLNDDGTPATKGDGEIGTRYYGSRSFTFAVFDQVIWDAVKGIPPGWEMPAWEELIIDALGLLPRIGPSVVLAATAVEVAVGAALDHLATKSAVNPELWRWINNRKDHSNEPSVEEQYDALMKALGGRSLKDQGALWEGFMNLKTARNKFVHEGVASIGGKKVDLGEARRLVNVGVEVIAWLDSSMPELRRSRFAPHRIETAFKVAFARVADKPV